ncbi:MAG TPA: RNase H family protein, partial [Corynebacterium sp.]|nr:RNase H family protein [Corynebacterium sp.]
MVLNEFIELWKKHQAGGMILYLADPGARSVLATLVEEGNLPGLELRGVVTGERMQETWMACRGRLVDMVLEARNANAPSGKHIVVATDASRRHGHRTTGLGVASSTGAVRLHTVKAATITEGEFAAVRLALHCWKKAERIDILTDSLIVYRRLNSHPIHAPASPSMRPLEAACVKTVNGYRDQGKVINVHWVRSHNGHILNDIADRAAVTARRCAQWDQKEMTQALSTQIREDLCADLNGVALHDL